MSRFVCARGYIGACIGACIGGCIGGFFLGFAGMGHGYMTRFVNGRYWQNDVDSVSLFKFDAVFPPFFSFSMRTNTFSKLAPNNLCTRRRCSNLLKTQYSRFPQWRVHVCVYTVERDGRTRFFLAVSFLVMFSATRHGWTELPTRLRVGGWDGCFWSVRSPRAFNF